MFELLHSFEPQPIIYALGPVKIYWYGLFIVLAIVAGSSVILRLAKKHGIREETIFDLLFWLVLGGLIGARIYDVLLELPYYAKQPLAILKIWQGGLAVHGAIIGCALTIFIFAKKRQLNFWLFASLVAVAAPLAQAIGRWGNYFNQELIGRQTALPWGIPIDIAHRPPEFLSFQYFHPTFLYESMGNLLIFLLLLSWHLLSIRISDESMRTKRYVFGVLGYAILYSILRFSLEFIKIDRTPHLFGMRWPQIASLVLIAISIVGLIILSRRQPPALNN